MLARAEADELRLILERAITGVDAACAAVGHDPEGALDELAATRLLLLTALTQI